MLIFLEAEAGPHTDLTSALQIIQPVIATVKLNYKFLIEGTPKYIK